MKRPLARILLPIIVAVAMLAVVGAATQSGAQESGEWYCAEGTIITLINDSSGVLGYNNPERTGTAEVVAERRPYKVISCPPGSTSILVQRAFSNGTFGVEFYTDKDWVVVYQPPVAVDPSEPLFCVPDTTVMLTNPEGEVALYDDSDLENFVTAVDEGVVMISLGCANDAILVESYEGVLWAAQEYAGFQASVDMNVRVCTPGVIVITDPGVRVYANSERSGRELGIANAGIISPSGGCATNSVMIVGPNARLWVDQTLTRVYFPGPQPDGGTEDTAAICEGDVYIRDPGNGAVEAYSSPSIVSRQTLLTGGGPYEAISCEGEFIQVYLMDKSRMVYVNQAFVSPWDTETEIPRAPFLVDVPLVHFIHKLIEIFGWLL